MRMGKWNVLKEKRIKEVVSIVNENWNGPKKREMCFWERQTYSSKRGGKVVLKNERKRSQVWKCLGE